MAKARKPTAFSSAAERFLGFHSRSPSSATVAPFPGDDDLPDLVESDIWYSQPSSDAPTSTADDQEDAEESTGRTPKKRVGGLSRAFADGRQVAASAPVQVPAWPSRFAELEPAALPCEQEDGWVPPHVYLARRQARASVVEGVGRTLKGRDASRVRDAVWSRTGFPG